MTAKDHNKLLGIFFFINAGLSVLGGLFVGLIYGGMGAMMLANGRRQEETMGAIFLVMAVVVTAMVLVFAAFYGFAGWKIYKEQKIGRILGIVASSICLLSFPLGTALGVYGLWFLLGDQGKAFYEGREMMPVGSPPPPNSWQ